MFENERFLPLRGWSSGNLLPTDRKRFSGPGGRNSTDFPVVTLGPGVHNTELRMLHLLMVCWHDSFGLKRCTPHCDLQGGSGRAHGRWKHLAMWTRTAGHTP